MTNGESLLQRMPPWVIATAIVAVVVLALLLFLSKERAGCSWESRGFSCAFEPARKMTPKTFYGYFYNWDKNGEVYCSSETVKLEFSEDQTLIKGRSSGKIFKDSHGNVVENSWILDGYKHGNNLALAYATEETPITGNGIYYLIENQGEYAGFWIGINSASGKVIQCPYLLTGTEMPGSESCERRWPHVFSATSTCREVAFPQRGNPAVQGTLRDAAAERP